MDAIVFLSSREDATDADSVSQRAFSARTGEDRLGERGHLQDSHTERSDNSECLERVNSVLGLGDHGWQSRDVTEYKLLENHQESDRNHRYERVLDERPQPTPEQPV